MQGIQQKSDYRQAIGFFTDLAASFTISLLCGSDSFEAEARKDDE
jgi:hypothetical protein